MIIKEQFTPAELKKQGYTTVKPSDYSPEKYDKQRAEGVTWYKKKGSGGTPSPAPSPAQSNLDDYVGIYSGSLGKVHIQKKGNGLEVLVKIRGLNLNADLVKTGTDEFKFERNSGIIKFNRSGNSVVSLDFKYGVFSFTANKEGGSTSTPNQPPSAWSCIEKYEIKSNVKQDRRIKPGKNKNERISTFKDGDTWTFYEDGTFKTIDDGIESKGKWACDGDSDFTINSDGWLYTSKKNIWESKENQPTISSLIRKTLIESKEKKEEESIQNNLIESRLKFIIGDQKIIKMTEDDQFKVSFQVFEEIQTLSSQGLLNENNLLQVFKGLFGDDVHSLPTTFYKPWIDNVLKTLNMNDSYLKEYLVSRLTKEPNEVWSSFESCEKMSHMIAKALSETLILHLRMDKDFTGLDDAKRTLEDSIRQDEFIKKLQMKIQSVICHLFDKYSTNASDVLTKLKK